jgi:hypothetical protein
MANEKKNTNLTAAQKLEQLESKIAQLNELVMADRRSIEVMAEEIERTNVNLSFLARRQNAIVDVLTDKNIANNDEVTRKIEDYEVNDLKEKIKFLVDQGVLVKDEEGTVNSNSFVVARDLLNGEVVVPRLQFSIPSLREENKQLILGKKVGDIITTDKSEVSTEITELYKIVETEKNLNFEQDQNQQG